MLFYLYANTWYIFFSTVCNRRVLLTRVIRWQCLKQTEFLSRCFHRHVERSGNLRNSVFAFALFSSHPNVGDSRLTSRAERN